MPESVEEVKQKICVGAEFFLGGAGWVRCMWRKRVDLNTRATRGRPGGLPHGVGSLDKSQACGRSVQIMKMFLDIAFPALGTALVAFFIWQIVAAINGRQSRRMRRFALGLLLGLPCYVVSFGPAYWWLRSTNDKIIPVIYCPLVEAAWRAPRPVILRLGDYASVGKAEHLRLGCGPLWKNGPRAFHWFSIEPFDAPTAPSAAPPIEVNREDVPHLRASHSRPNDP